MVIMGFKNDGRFECNLKERIMGNNKFLKDKRGGSELLAFIIVVAVTASIVTSCLPKLSKSVEDSMTSIPKVYSSTDTIVFD